MNVRPMVVYLSPAPVTAAVCIRLRTMSRGYEVVCAISPDTAPAIRLNRALGAYLFSETTSSAFTIT